MSRLISRSTRRNSAVGVSALRSKVSLCWTRGWSTSVNIAGPSEHCTVACDPNGRAAVRAALARDAPSGRPRAALEHLRQREAGGVTSENVADGRRDLVQKRDGQRAPLYDELAVDHVGPGRLVLRHQHARVDEEPAIPVLREAGQRVQALDPPSRSLERLDERVGEPLRELVEGDDAVAWDGTVTPCVAQGHTVDRKPPRPYRPQHIEKDAKDARGLVGQQVEEIAELAAEAAVDHRAETAQERRPLRHPDQGVVRPNPEG